MSISNVAMRDDWFLASLQNVIVSLREDPYSRDIRPQIKRWISEFNSCSNETKERQVSYALNWLLGDDQVTMKQIKWLCTQLKGSVFLEEYQHFKRISFMRELSTLK